MLFCIGGTLFVIGCWLYGFGHDVAGVSTAYLGVVFLVAEHARARAALTRFRIFRSR